MKKVSLEEIVSLAKRRGFVYPTSEIYGGLANSYDYGPLGTELLRNIRELWWQEFIHKRTDMVGLDSAIIQHPDTWVASGHVESLTDPLVEDKKTHKRYRVDHLIEAWLEKNPEIVQDVIVEDLDLAGMAAFLKEHMILSPDGNELTDVMEFNLLFETHLGAVSGEKSKAYLRGETAQGIFTNFKQIIDSSRVQLPFGVGQIGKSFRNEITTGQFVFRTLEFEQAEIEYFFNPAKDDWQNLFKSWQDAIWSFATKSLGIPEDSLRWRQHTDTERSHYSKDTWDLDFKFPFGFKELWGLAYRTDFDLKQHAKHSGKKLEYRDPVTNEVFVPHVIEPAVGITRIALMVLCSAYWRDEARNRTVLRLDPKLAPYKVAVFPLLKNKPELVAKARIVFELLQQDFHTMWDDRGNIGKRYLYQDEIGTPYCVTIDFDTLTSNKVTIRHRDSAEQEQVAIDELKSFLKNNI